MLLFPPVRASSVEAPALRSVDSRAGGVPLRCVVTSSPVGFRAGRVAATCSLVVGLRSGGSPRVRGFSSRIFQDRPDRGLPERLYRDFPAEPMRPAFR